MYVFHCKENKYDDVLFKCQNFLYSSIFFSNKYRTEGVLYREFNEWLGVAKLKTMLKQLSRSQWIDCPVYQWLNQRERLLKHDAPLHHFTERVASIFCRDIFSQNMVFVRDFKPFLGGTVIPSGLYVITVTQPLIISKLPLVASLILLPRTDS